MIIQDEVMDKSVEIMDYWLELMDADGDTTFYSDGEIWTVHYYNSTVTVTTNNGLQRKYRMKLEPL